LHGQIVIDTSFEGSNARVLSINNSENSVKIESVKKRGDIHNVVFYFKISNFDSTRALKIRVKYSQQYYLPVLAAYSYDKITWVRIPGYISGDSKEFINMYSRRNVYFCYGYPYVYSRILEIENMYSGNPNVNVSGVSTSELGRTVKLFKFTNPNIPDTGKVSVWILGRNHAMESHSNYVIEGLMNFLASDDIKAQRLRTQALIYIVTIMDVDMAYLGGTGKDQLPVDFNRDWDSPSYWNAVRDVKSKILQTSAQNNLKIFIDSHNPFPGESDTTSRNFFFSLYSSGIKSMNLDNFRNLLFQNGGYYFGRKPLYPTNGQTSSRWVDSVISTIDFSVTLETGWTNRTDNSQWTIYFYNNQGIVLGKSISDYINQSTPVVRKLEKISGENKIYPNPVNSSALIRFSITGKENIYVRIFDIMGKEKVYVNLGVLDFGDYDYNLDVANFTSGVYFYRIESERKFLKYTGKFIVLK
jgi:hypothetical protein